MSKGYQVLIIAALAAFTAATSSAARAENWVQMDPNNAVYYDADSVFVDSATAYIVYNSATDPDGDGTFNYSTLALDCGARRVFALGWVLQNGGYEVDPGWNTDTARVKPIQDGTIGSLAEQTLCPARGSFRSGSIQ